jgi:hypothetical protein
MCLFSIQPVLLGYLIWQLLNTLPWFFAVWSLPINEKQKAIITWLCLPELITSLQNSQSNGLVAALLVFSFTNAINGNYFKHALSVVAGLFIKIFGAAGALFYFFGTNKLKPLIWYVVIFACFLLMPLLFTSSDSLITQYQNWFGLLKNDPVHELNLSVQSLAEKIFQIHFPSWIMQVIGFAVFIIPVFLNIKNTNTAFLLQILSSLLIWVVLFNHKAESPTFIIAITGAMLWLTSKKNSTPTTILMLLVFVFTSLSSSDLFPKWVRQNWFMPYGIKSIPCLLVWILLQIEIYRTTLKNIRGNKNTIQKQ